MRKLATVRKILELTPIEGADRIEVATVDGWKVVVKKGDYQVGNPCIYLEIDSWVPTTLAPFLTKEGKEPKEYKGVKGERLKTVKLKQQVSQGLILPLEVLPRKEYLEAALEGKELDLDTLLGVIKYDPESDSQLRTARAGQPANYTCKVFPTNLFPKTDQERIQNCFNTRPKDHTWEVTLKLDGSSCTIFKHKGKLRVCSRNLELPMEPVVPWWRKVLASLKLLKMKPWVPDNNFAKMALQVKSNLEGVEGYAFQGELMGPGIQGNREGFKELQWFVYDVVELSSRRYLPPAERRGLCALLGLQHAPVLELASSYPASVAQVLELADNTKSITHPVAEGLVFKSNKDPALSFKAISNKYLLKSE